MSYPTIIFLDIIYIILNIGIFIALRFFDVEDFRQFGRVFVYFNFIFGLAVLLYAIFGMTFGF